MKRQLADLEKKMEEAETAASSRRNRTGGAVGTSKPALVKKELAQMLDYKRQVLRDLDDATNDSSKNTGPSLASIRSDLEIVKQQVEALESHWKTREEVLAKLRVEIEQEKGR